jgi:aminoglycoside phosphotransferase (APT) family kinase protein
VPEWQADVVVDEDDVRGLIAAQFPSLALRGLRRLAEGWDNAVWVVDDAWLFRFPRRQIAIPGVEREIAVLPRLAPLLPAPIPRPKLVGRPAGGYPWPFFGARLLAGGEAAEAGLTEAARVLLARPFGRFLHALHRPETLAAVAGHALPADPMGRADMALRVPRTLAILEEVERAGLWRAPDSLGDVLEAARALPAPEASAVVHGDLHVRHLLVDRAGGLTGVIDWGDLCRADPSVDLILFWSFLPPRAREEFLAGYGPVGPERLLRARVLSLFLSATLLLYAEQEAMPNLRAESLAGLARAAAAP